MRLVVAVPASVVVACVAACAAACAAACVAACIDPARLSQRCSATHGCEAGKTCVNELCTAEGEGEGVVGEGEGVVGEGEGVVGEGEGVVAEGEGVVGEGEGGVGEGEGVVGEGEGVVAGEGEGEGDPCVSGADATVVNSAGHCLAFFDVAKTWTEAERACRSIALTVAAHAHLADIEDAAEDALMRSLAPVDTIAWIGLNDVAVEGAFSWSDGAAAVFTPFSAGEPNNNGDEDCVQSTATGWNDAACSNGLTYVCEVERVVSSCGDGVVNAFEECDDGNTGDGDGCSSTCAVEADSECYSNAPSFCALAADVFHIPDDGGFGSSVLSAAKLIAVAPGVYPTTSLALSNDHTFVATGAGVDVQQTGTVIAGATLTVVGLHVSSDAVIYQVADGGKLVLNGVDLGASPGACVIADAGSQLVVQRSVIHDCGAGAVDVQTDDYLVENSVVHDCGGGTAVTLGASALKPTSHFRHNTIANNGSDGITCTSVGLAEQSIFRGNGGVDVVSPCSAIESIVDDGAAGFGNSSANPQFANGTFRLSSTSPAINASVLSNAVVDVEGRTRDALPDIGAFEAP